MRINQRECCALSRGREPKTSPSRGADHACFSESATTQCIYGFSNIGGGLELARPVRLATTRMGGGFGFGLRRYDVMPGGTHLVAVTPDTPAPPEIRVMLDFGSLLSAMTECTS